MLAPAFRAPQAPSPPAARPACLSGHTPGDSGSEPRTAGRLWPRRCRTHLRRSEGRKEAVNRGPWAAEAQGGRQRPPGRVRRRPGHWPSGRGLGVGSKGEPQVTRKTPGGAARRRKWMGWGQGSPGRPANRPRPAAPDHTASSQSGGRATGGPWSSGGSPVQAGRGSGGRPRPLPPPHGLPRAPHLPYVVSDAPVGHHFQGVQGHLLGAGAVLGEPVAEPVGEQEAQDHCGYQEHVGERMGGQRVQVWVVSRPGWG